MRFFGEANLSYYAGLAHFQMAPILGYVIELTKVIGPQILHLFLPTHILEMSTCLIILNFSVL